MQSTHRTLTEHTREFVLPDRLAELVGPPGGSLVLPDTIYWGPESRIDLSHRDDLSKAYEATLREGDASEVRSILNAELLRAAWSWIVVPTRIRLAWESRFPELAA